MSVNLMSAIFQTEFFDLPDAEGKITKASTAKLVLLAMADNANDEGEGVYPAIETLSKKCALSEQTIRNTFDSLLYNGIIYRVGVSKYMTHNHTINTKSFPSSKNKRDFPSIYIEVKPVEGLTDTEKGSNEYAKEVKPVDPNHQGTINKASTPGSIKGIQAAMYADRPVTVDDLPLMELALTEFHAALSLPHNWNWYPAKTSDESAWRELREFVFAEWQKDERTFRKYATWRATPYVKGALSNLAIQRRPTEFITSWSDYLASSSMYGQEKSRGFAL